METIPYTRHVLDWSAYRILATLAAEPRAPSVLGAPRTLSASMLPDMLPLYFRGYILSEGGSATGRWYLTEHGLDFVSVMRWKLGELLREHPGCSACGGVYHPATGHVLSPRMRLCGGCAKDHLRWLKGMLNRKWGKADFYKHAASSVRPS